MTWYAVEGVDEAIDATRSFLVPVEAATWLRLALIALFVGIGGSGTSLISNSVSVPANMPAESASRQPTPVPPEPSLEALPVEPIVIAAVVVAVVLVILALRLLSETLRLVLYDALRTDTVRIRGPARRRFGQAVRLFGFKLAVNIVFALPFVVIGGAVVLTGVDIGRTAFVAGALLAAVVVPLSAIAYLLTVRITNEFVTPIMVLTDSGVFAGWRRFWPILRADFAQFGVYLVVHFLLLLAISIGQSIIGVILLGIVGTVGGLVGLLVVLGVFGGLNAALASALGAVAVGAIVLLTILVAVVLYLPIKIIALTYVFSYELSVLGAADEELRLLPAASSDGSDGHSGSAA